MPIASSATAMPRPMNMLLYRIETNDSSSIGNSMYAATAKMLAAVER